MSTEQQRQITYPTVLPSSLSADARRLYALAKDGKGNFKGDPFAEDYAKRYHYLPKVEDYVLTERDKAAVAEIENAHLGTLNEYGPSLSVRPIHPQYTAIEGGSGNWIVQVGLMPLRGEFLTAPENAIDFATIVGAEIDSRTDRRMSTIEVKADHASARSESGGELSRLASLSLVNPQIEMVGWSGRVQITGTLTDARLYPLGVNPFWGYEDEGEEGALHTDEWLPPRVEIPLPTLAVIHAYPRHGFAPTPGVLPDPA